VVASGAGSVPVGEEIKWRISLREEKK